MRLYGQRHHGCRFDEIVWRGHRVVVLENEVLRLSILASKGADIIEFRFKPRDLDVLWHGTNTIKPPGEYVPTKARAAGSFMDYYPGGWQEAFPNAGPPSEWLGAELGTHGEVSLLPWDYAVSLDSPDRVALDFVVETPRTPFRLERRMIIESSSAVLRIEETVTNLGLTEMPFMWLHHPAFGPPFLEEGCMIDMPRCEGVVATLPVRSSHRFMPGQSALFPFYVDPHGNDVRADKVPSSKTCTEDVLFMKNLDAPWCAIRNESQQIAVGMTWDPNIFKHLSCWMLYGGRMEYPFYGRGYAVAFEPSTSPIEPLEVCAAEGRCPILRPGESLNSFLEVGIFETDRKIIKIEPGGRLVHE